ncbi:MAG TPA: endo-1,4-beta-xylanase, partial [Emticicia sp.]
MKLKIFLLVVWGIVLFSNFTYQETTIPPKSLKEAFKKDFMIGTALNSSQIEERNPTVNELIIQQFNAATPENVMKSALVHPKWDTYDFSMGDKLIEYGKKHNIKINGHTLIWHSQLPGFMRRMQSDDSVKTFFTDHIRTVASHY